MNTTLLFTYLGTLLILIATPGPVVALVVGTSGARGHLGGGAHRVG
ncbi:LysE family translocator, partial [Pseudomonas sp. MAFF212427]|nr:LysE family translocator [Pseudomonas brassicae]